MKVIKENKTLETFNPQKIKNVLDKVFKLIYTDDVDKYVDLLLENILKKIKAKNVEEISIEEIQIIVENTLMEHGFYDIARKYIIYRNQHKESKFIRDRIDYMSNYANSDDNAASSSETDPNANVIQKNVANLDGEVYKTKNRIIQRQRMKDELNILYPEVAKQYEVDVENHIIYPHDEASVPTLKFYCQADTLYPLMTEGVGNIDGVTPTPPNDLQSFSGQITNLTFLLSSQCKGAVAFGEYFIALNYYIIAEFGDKWYENLDCVVTNSHCKIQRTVRDFIEKAFKQFIYGINQPAGNRSYQCPFTNISYYDHTYFDSLFGEFYYPDGTKPEWAAINVLQKMFMKFFNKLRTKQILTFPVETLAMVHDGKDIIDKEYKDFCAEMYAEGHSFFTYISDNADSLASCCRLRNELTENTFNPTSGLTGVMTGSCNVITLNINRIVQDCDRYYNGELHPNEDGSPSKHWEGQVLWKCIFYPLLKEYLIKILDRVYKYHIAFKTMLYDLEDKNMFAASNGGYIHISKLFSTIGINGLNEAARFLGLKVGINPEYIEFLQLILGTIKEQNKLHAIHDRKRPFLFNSEVVPAESLGGKNYRWDKEDGLEPMSI